MYQEMMNAMGMQPVQQPMRSMPQQNAPQLPAGMTMEQWLQWQKMQQLSLNNPMRGQAPMILADAKALLGGRSDAMSSADREAYFRATGERISGESQQPIAPTTQPAAIPERQSTQTVDQAAVRSMLQKRAAEDAQRKSAQEAARLEEERIRAERAARAAKVNLNW